MCPIVFVLIFVFEPHYVRLNRNLSNGLSNKINPFIVHSAAFCGDLNHHIRLDNGLKELAPSNNENH